MSFGKLYGFKDNQRTAALLVIAKENNLDVELVETRPQKGVSTDYLKISPQGKIPAFQGADGVTIMETLAIAIYFASQNPKTTLLGRTKQDYAHIIQWMSWANMEHGNNIVQWLGPINGMLPYNKKSVDQAIEKTNKTLKVLEDHLTVHTYLVGEQLTLADLVAGGALNRGFQTVLDKQWRQEHPQITRWVETVVNQPMWKKIHGEPKFAEEAMKYQPPAKDKAAEKPKEKAKEKPKPKDEDDEEDEPKPQPPAKHPLDSLGKAKMPIDEWKRTYKNSKDIRGAAMPWFWQNVPFDDYSIWKVDYKYNDELTLTFMSANLVGGFFARLEASRKYLMGVESVYGETNNSVITGVFLVRGQEAMPAFDVAPDVDSYEFKKLDPTNPKDKEFVEDIMEGEKNLEVNGKSLPYADGKVFV